MRVLIVESNPDLGSIWRRYIERLGCDVVSAASQTEAIDVMREEDAVHVILLDLVIGDGSAFAVADFAAYRHPAARVIFVTNTTFFSDGSIFQHIPNACAFVQSHTPPEDLVAMVEHHGAAAQPGSRLQ